MVEGIKKTTVVPIVPANNHNPIIEDKNFSGPITEKNDGVSTTKWLGLGVLGVAGLGIGIWAHRRADTKVKIPETIPPSAVRSIGEKNLMAVITGDLSHLDEYLRLSRNKDGLDPETSHLFQTLDGTFGDLEQIAKNRNPDHLGRPRGGEVPKEGDILYPLYQALASGNIADVSEAVDDFIALATNQLTLAQLYDLRAEVNIRASLALKHLDEVRSRLGAIDAYHPLPDYNSVRIADQNTTIYRDRFNDVVKRNENDLSYRMEDIHRKIRSSNRETFKTVFEEVRNIRDQLNKLKTGDLDQQELQSLMNSMVSLNDELLRLARYEDHFINEDAKKILSWLDDSVYGHLVDLAGISKSTDELNHEIEVIAQARFALNKYLNSAITESAR